MPDVIPAYPLQWPAGWKRTPANLVARGKFSARGDARQGSQYRPMRDVTIREAIMRVRESLMKMAIHEDDIVLSTNLPLRLDGWPRADAKEPDDAGAAVYWLDPFTNTTRCMAIDQYSRVAQNIAALAATLEAMRAIERHGGAAILDRAFAGFAALPSPAAAETWWAVLGVDRSADVDTIKAAYRRLAALNHPDRGGDAQRMAAINQAYQEAQSNG